jgi:hypothetical protein
LREAVLGLQTIRVGGEFCFIDFLRGMNSFHGFISLIDFANN